MKSAITVSLVPEAKGGPFVFWDGLEVACRDAASLGFDAVEIFPPGASALEVEKTRKIVEAHGLKVAAVGTGAGWVLRQLRLSHRDASARESAVEFVKEIIAVAAEFGAPAIVGSMQGRWEAPGTRDDALGWLAESLSELSQYASRSGQVLLYEPLNRYETNLLNNLGDAARFLERYDLRNLRLLADLFHLNIEEHSIPAAVRQHGKHIGHVHYADSNRLAMGLGHTEAGPILAALREIGYKGYLSAEVLPLPDSQTAAKQTIMSIKARDAC